MTVTARSTEATPTRRVTIVTGASGGLGTATCRTLAELGDELVLVGRDHGRLAHAAELVAEVRPGACVMLLEVDVTREADTEYMASAAADRFGRIDALVTCAGVAQASGAGLLPRPVARLDPDEWSEILDTNLTGVFLSNRAVLPIMRDNAGGDIINVVSDPAGRSGRPFAAAYSASKRAVRCFSDALATEVASMGVRVQSISPAVIDTPMARTASLPKPWLCASDVANVIAQMLTLPRDCRLERPVLTPALATPSQMIGGLA